MQPPAVLAWLASPACLLVALKCSCLLVCLGFACVLNPARHRLRNLSARTNTSALKRYEMLLN